MCSHCDHHDTKRSKITRLLENFDLDSDGSRKVGANTRNNLDLFNKVMGLKGSSYHTHFQKHLKSCKELLIKKEAPDIWFHYEPANRWDENAIVVQAELVQAACVKDWQPIEYMSGQKVSKVTIALKNNDIPLVTLKNVLHYPAIQILSIDCCN